MSGLQKEFELVWLACTFNFKNQWFPYYKSGFNYIPFQYVSYQPSLMKVGGSNTQSSPPSADCAQCFWFLLCCHWVNVLSLAGLATVSTYSVVQRKIDPTVIKYVVQEHQRQVITSQDNEDVLRIHVRRASVFSDALRQFSKPTLDVSKMLQVRFVGEEAVDEGGPRRKFFNLLMHDIFKSELFAGFPDHVVPLHNVETVAKNVYFIIGKMIATCIV